MTCLSIIIVILLMSNLPSALCLLGEGLRGPPPCISCHVCGGCGFLFFLFWDDISILAWGVRRVGWFML